MKASGSGRRLGISTVQLSSRVFGTTELGGYLVLHEPKARLEIKHCAFIGQVSSIVADGSILHLG